MFLTDEELFTLTGRRQSRRQVEWLRERRWRFEQTAQGRVRVARAYFDKRMCGTPEPDERIRPNLKAVA